jgi:hypothetical protein
MAEMMKMHPNLMGPAAVQLALNQTELLIRANDAVPGFCGTTADRSDAHPLSMDGMPADLLLDHSGGSAQFSRGEGEIDFLDGAGGKLEGQPAMRLIVFGNDQTTARFFVETVHDSGPFFSADAGKSGAMMKQRVYQSVFPVTGARMNDQASGLIDDKQIGVFEKNIERDCFRLIVDLFGRGLGQLDFRTAPDEIARARRGAVHRHGTVANQLLQTRPRILGQLTREKAIEAKPGGFRHGQFNGG